MRKIILFTLCLAVALFTFDLASAQDAQHQKETMKATSKQDKEAAKAAKKQEKDMMKADKKRAKEAMKGDKKDMGGHAMGGHAMGGHAMNVTMTGAAEVPGPGDTDGTGTASITLNHSKGEVCYDLTVQDVQNPTAAHIHVGAAGASGPPKVTLKANAQGQWKGCVAADKDLIKDLMQNPANYYVNVHNAEFPGGALRGQLGK